MHFRSRLLALTIALILSACSGGAQSNILPPSGSQMASVALSIAIPPPTSSGGISPKYISSATKSASVTVNAGVAVIFNCASGSCTATLQAPVGSDTFAVTLYDATNGTGNILSQGSTTATIVAGTANSVNVTFSGVIKTVALSGSSSNFTKGTASSITVTVLALDAAGNTIVGSYTSPITIATSDTANTSLNVGSVSSSSATVTLSYNGSNSYAGTTVSASATGTNTATLGIGTGSNASCSRQTSSGGATIRGYYPCDLQAAYQLPSTGPATTQTVAIVDAYDDPNAEADLGVYRSTFGLPACTTANGCFRKVNQTGGSTLPVADSSWATEISLDLDMVSAACPNCHILLLEANSPDDHTVTGGTDFDLEDAENTAAASSVAAISNSFGGPEDPSQSTYDSYYNHPGIAITVSSGDDAYAGGTQYPASAPTVIGVGGTHLTTATNSRGWSETAWFGRCSGGTICGSGSGCSRFETKPTWQTDTGCAKRMVADVAADADPSTGVAVYDTYSASGWLVFGGTSASAPFVAGVFALAGNASSFTNPASHLYANPGGLFDVTGGTTGTCSTAYFCAAGVGYDGPTGLGTPNGGGGLTAFNQMIAAPIATQSAAIAQQEEVPAERTCALGAGRYACMAMVRTDIGWVHVSEHAGPVKSKL